MWWWRLAEVVEVSTGAEVEMEVAVVTCLVLLGVTRGAVVAVAVVTCAEVVGILTGAEAGVATIGVALVTFAGLVSRSGGGECLAMQNCISSL